jgi:hypothetical protein
MELVLVGSKVVAVKVSQPWLALGKTNFVQKI